MEYQIGEEITINKKACVVVKVVEHTDCEGCYFMCKCKHDNRKTIKMEYGECSCLERKDGKNVIFQFMKEIKNN